MALLNLQFLYQTPSVSLQSPSYAFIISSTRRSLVSLPSPISLTPSRPRVRVSISYHQEKGQDEILKGSEDDLGEDSEVFKKTLRLVECSMFASVAGLAYLLSNSLAIENYFGCFFSLPIVISSMRWGVAAGRKTMVATAMLLLTLSGPVKASTYLLMHGLVGVTMGSLWRLGVNWGLSIAICTFVIPCCFISQILYYFPLRRCITYGRALNVQVRALGAIGYVLISSFLIRENILNLITINIHASLTYIFMSIGVNSIPTMDAIYTIFGSLLLVNCGFFVFLLHILYAVFLTKLGMKESLTLPGWLKKAV